MRIPVIDIGDRQKGRVFSDCLIHCEPDRNEIIAAMRRAATPEFREIAKNVRNPFGDGTTSEQMVAILKKTLAHPLSVKKDFFDVSFEV